VSVVTVNLATGPNVAFCANTPGTTLIANVPGVSGCTFEWRVQGDPAVFATTSSVTVTPAAATTYEVTVNCSGCTATRPILVTPQQPPAVNAEPDKTVCAGEQTTLTATGALTYTWQPGTNLTGNAILVTPAGPATTYTVTGTDLNGCTNTDVVTVTVNSLTSPNIPAVADICVGQSTQLNPAGVPQPDETYTWVPGSSLVGANTLNPTANPTVSTVYTLTIANTANGCSATSVVPLVVNPLPVATIVGDNFICANELKLYFATGGTSYEWLDAAGNIIGTNSNILINPLENTTFRVRATANGCTGLEVTKTIQVLPVPEPAIVVNNGVNLACESEPVIVQYTGIRVPNDVATWSFNGGSATNLGADSFGPYQVTWPQAGDYVISVQVQAGTCVASTASNFSIRTRPVVSTNSNLYYYCQGGGLANAPTIQGAVLNTGGGPCSYTWSPTTGLSNPFSLTPVAAPTQTTIYTLSATCKGCTGNTATVEVRVVPPPTVVVDTFVQTYCAGTKVDLLAIPEGLGPFSYEWSPTVGLSDFTAANPFANPTVSTVYCVTVTDRNGCKSAPTCVFVDVIPLPVANAGPDKQICLGSGLGVYLEGSGSSGGFGSVSYLWEPADYLSDPTDPNAYANPPTTTIYKLRAINTLTGCSSDATGLNDVYTVVVKVEDLPIVDAGPNASICFGESYSMKGAWLQGGTSPYTYFWEPTLGLTDPTNPLTEAKPNYTTKYFLKAKSAVGCVSLADSVTIEVLPRPTIRTTPNVSPTVCPGDSTQLFTQVTGAPLDGIRYSWVPTDGLSDPTAANPFASPQQTTTYTVTAYYDPDGNPLNGPGCQTSKPDTVRVQVFPTPTVNANPNNQRFVLCAATDAPIVLPATLTNITLQPYTLKWEPSAGLSDSTVLNPTAKPTESTDYTLTVTTGTCSVSSVVRVEVLTFVKAQIIASDDTVCAGNPVELVAIGGVGQARFTWILPDSTTREGARIVLNPTESGLYRVIITEGGCQDQADILITALINPTAGFTYTYAQGCRDLKVSFFDQSLLATQWRWDFGDGTAVSNVPNPVHEYARPGVYRVVLSVVSEDGCLQSLTAATDVVVSEPVNPDFTFSPSNSDGPIYLYTPIQFTDASVGAVRWQWSFGDGQASSVQNPEHLFKTPGAFSVRLVVIDNVGCTYEVEKPVIILPPLLNTPNVFTPNGDGVNDRWKPDYAGTETFDFRVFDRFGILVFTGNSTEGGWDGRFSNTDVPAGVYFYTFELNGRQYDGSFTLVR
jgi:gliding motility-associated-like protein